MMALPGPMPTWICKVHLTALVPASHKYGWPRGTYIPTANSSDRDASFVMKAGVGIYGGFVGGETLLSQRNWVTNPTILSGDIDNSPGDNTGNSYHVVIAAFADDVPTTRLDGFTITGGNANGNGNITVNGVGIFRNFGGGMYTNGGTNTLTNNTISGNTALSTLGGGILTIVGTNTLTNTIIWGNSSGIINFNSTLTVSYSIIEGALLDVLLVLELWVMVI